ncbi:LamG domain-containing protein [Haloferula sp. BvORR071]|uniref:LamG domain-containing protein n=1 Tax=Haloferula sp. BvORR071 TaxID=1396141 RepID=UPI000554CED3|nr:LamG domain-containing protein [Haloferula sp. BvORR071]
MNRRTMERIDGALDGDLDAAEFAALQEELREDPAALDHWCRQAEIHGRLEWELAAGEPPIALQKPSKSPLMARWGAAAAILAGGMALGWILGHSHAPAPAVATKPAVNISYGTETVGRITASEGTTWTGKPYAVGDWIGTGPVELSAGTVGITFDCGAAVQVTGPAKLHLTSPTRALLESGKATVDIPGQAYGFVFETPTTEISRRMSRFALAVDVDGHTEIHVLDGQIQLSGKLRDLGTPELGKNSSLQVDKGGSVVKGTRYRPEQLTTSLPESADLLPEWFMHWGFDTLDTKTGIFDETGKQREGEPKFPAQVHLSHPDAEVSLVPGRFGNAVRMNGQRGFLATDFPGISGSSPRTIAFWVRIDPDTPEVQAYSFLSWGTKEGGAKWQLSWNRGNDNSGVVGAIRTEVELGFHVGSTNLKTGRWHHVVSVFSGGDNPDVASQVRHYVDGRLEGTTAVLSRQVDTKTSGEKAVPLTIGRRLDTDDYFRTFRGEMDEVYLFPSALTPEQIERLYRDNQAPELRR